MRNEHTCMNEFRYYCSSSFNISIRSYQRYTYPVFCSLIVPDVRSTVIVSDVTVHDTGNNYMINETDETTTNRHSIINTTINH